MAAVPRKKKKKREKRPEFCCWHAACPPARPLIPSSGPAAPGQTHSQLSPRLPRHAYAASRRVCGTYTKPQISPKPRCMIRVGAGFGEQLRADPAGISIPIHAAPFCAAPLPHGAPPLHGTPPLHGIPPPNRASSRGERARQDPSCQISI